ncbi:hypothetical protein RJO15_02650 [Herbaspirillum huttiense F1]|jgi:hypothetical protein|uniref:Uncharacterized protein n=1 Tax=Herbaspirillum huttiense subsp. lycopersici TaxID=3074428 RepID=A0ABU2EJX9_9BURK|nr:MULTISPECIES: hypothetical protein [Herbaspirillum]MBP1314066.1 hypothetical protein [Herbaspirillum sp. 1130]MDR9848178.1 hypothetical protein [Herbaspirillum huttiense SE1]MDT0354659.1 hypothetical protein [Herbaspirillum huttiense F1]
MSNGLLTAVAAGLALPPLAVIGFFVNRMKHIHQRTQDRIFTLKRGAGLLTASILGSISTTFVGLYLIGMISPPARCAGACYGTAAASQVDAIFWSFLLMYLSFMLFLGFGAQRSWQLVARETARAQTVTTPPEA